MAARALVKKGNGFYFNKNHFQMSGKSLFKILIDTHADKATNAIRIITIKKFFIVCHPT
jgi:hypothetical protein